MKTRRQVSSGEKKPSPKPHPTHTDSRHADSTSTEKPVIPAPPHETQRSRAALLLLSILLTVLSCPFAFYCNTKFLLEHSWMSALNVAVENGSVFGKDFVFTWGPLGFLGTRIAENINKMLLIGGDLLLLISLYHLLHTCFLRKKGWFIPVAAAIITMRMSNYSVTAFTVFVILSMMVLADKNSRKSTYVLTATWGAVLFFIKANYSFIALMFMVLNIGITARTNKKSALLMLLVYVGVFASIYACVPIDMIGYIKHSLTLIAHYEEAMYIPLQPGHYTYGAAILFGMGIAVLTAVYTIKKIKERTLTAGDTLIMVYALATFFLYYKNAFTRADFHYISLYSIFPLFFIGLLFTTNCTRTLAPKIASIIVSAISFFVLANSGKDAFENEETTVREWIVPKRYITEMMETPERAEHWATSVAPELKSTIGTHTIDLFPHDLSYLFLNGLNYRGRPVPQSYTAYAPSLDSLNLNFYTSPRRPERVLISNIGIDHRYYFWDESLTKAALHLNYTISDTFAMQHRRDKLLLLHAAPSKNLLPVMEPIVATHATIGVPVRIPQDNNRPIYMTLKLKYSTAGRMTKLFYQCPQLHIILKTDDGQAHIYKMIKPIMETPVLINKYIKSTSTLANFLCGDLQKNMNITSFVVVAEDGGYEEDMDVTFFRFSNY